MKNIWNKIGLWFVELVTVFIGVYLAFLLNGYRIQRQHKHKKQQIYAALYHYFSGLHLKNSKENLKNYYVSDFLKPYRKGEMPRLKKPPRYLIFSINERTWNTMLQAGGINLLNVAFVVKINEFFVVSHGEQEMITHFNHMVDTKLLPDYDADISKFYNMKKKKLKPDYEWYVNFIIYTQNELNDIDSQVNQILKMLKQKMNKEQRRKIEADSTG
jgi:hypothetical protein